MGPAVILLIVVVIAEGERPLGTTDAASKAAVLGAGAHRAICCQLNERVQTTKNLLRSRHFLDDTNQIAPTSQNETPPVLLVSTQNQSTHHVATIANTLHSNLTVVCNLPGLVEVKASC